MKGSGVLVASAVVAASAAIHLSGDNQVRVSNSLPQCDDSSSSGSAGVPQRTGPSVEKFAPRFDGLRFIETLVTAHR